MGMKARGPTSGSRMSSACGAMNATIVHSCRLPPSTHTPCCHHWCEAGQRPLTEKGSKKCIGPHVRHIHSSTASLCCHNQHMLQPQGPVVSHTDYWVGHNPMMFSGVWPVPETEQPQLGSLIGRRRNPPSRPPQPHGTPRPKQVRMRV